MVWSIPLSELQQVADFADRILCECVNVCVARTRACGCVHARGRVRGRVPVRACVRVLACITTSCPHSSTAPGEQHRAWR